MLTYASECLRLQPRILWRASYFVGIEPTMFKEGSFLALSSGNCGGRRSSWEKCHRNCTNRYILHASRFSSRSPQPKFSNYRLALSPLFSTQHNPNDPTIIQIGVFNRVIFNNLIVSYRFRFSQIFKLLPSSPTPHN
jgi:hypothetical protein